MKHFIYFRTVYEVWGFTVKIQCSTPLPLVVGHGAIFIVIHTAPALLFQPFESTLSYLCYNSVFLTHSDNILALNKPIHLYNV